MGIAQRVWDSFLDLPIDISCSPPEIGTPIRYTANPMVAATQVGPALP